MRLPLQTAVVPSGSRRLRTPFTMGFQQEYRRWRGSYEALPSMRSHHSCTWTSYEKELGETAACKARSTIFASTSLLHRTRGETCTYLGLCQQQHAPSHKAAPHNERSCLSVVVQPAKNTRSTTGEKNFVDSNWSQREELGECLQTGTVTPHTRN